MYTRNLLNITGFNVNTSYEGETIEKKINRIVNNKEPIKDGAPLIYTDRREGTQPQYDIRTDRFELATEAMDYITKSKLTTRDNYHKERTEKEKAEKNIGDKAKEGMNKENIGGAEPNTTTDSK